MNGVLLMGSDKKDQNNQGIANFGLENRHSKWRRANGKRITGKPTDARVRKKLSD